MVVLPSRDPGQITAASFNWPSQEGQLLYNREMEKAIFGGGCFWCTEAVFKMLKGVGSVLPGYAGGTRVEATYEKVSSGRTGHAEVTYVEFDPQIIKYRDLLTVFFASHDPTTLNRQGNDIGPQYRSVIFYTTEGQRTEAEKFIAEINLTSTEGGKVVTELVPFQEFFEAENYHKDYYATHQDQSYCQIIINPKLEKVQKQFAELMKEAV
jgi:peptide-methionine (S)-S-oxide reductase